MAEASAISTTPEGTQAAPAPEPPREPEDWEKELAAFRQTENVRPEPRPAPALNRKVEQPANRKVAPPAPGAPARVAQPEPAVQPAPPLNRRTEPPAAHAPDPTLQRAPAPPTPPLPPQTVPPAASAPSRAAEPEPVAKPSPPRHEAETTREPAAQATPPLNRKTEPPIARAAEPALQEATVPPIPPRPTQPERTERRAQEPTRKPEPPRQQESAREEPRHMEQQASSTESAKSERTPKQAAPAQAAPAAEPPEPLIRVETVAAHVALLTLNAPKIRNALTAEMRLALRGVLKALAADDNVHVLIITGAGGNFCAGGDVRTMGETDAAKIRQRMTEVAETAEALAAFPKPVIAAVSGHAAGAGVSLACLADIIVADENAQFTFSFLRLALGPDWGLSWTLPRRVGATRARGLILSRGVIDARQARDYGLVDRFASEGEVRDSAIALAKEICNGPREATAAIKRMLSDLDGLRAALASEMAMQLERFPAWEHQEGAKAFKEKRPADYDKDRTP